MKRSKKSIGELRKEIVIERLRQAPPTIKISFGMTGGKFLNRDELITQVKEDTQVGKKIVNMQFAYIKALKKGLILEKK